MINFLHTFHPQRIALLLGPITIYWYGLIMVLAMLLALLVAVRLAKKYQIKSERVLDLSFWLIIFGLLGARLYDVLLNLSYYLQYPGKILAVWEGGLAIHGAIIAGLITVVVWTKKQNTWLWLAIITPALALGQAIGRFGNYFNQELFGRPTNLPWGIPIDLINRPNQFISYEFFQPTFLYESLGCLLIFILLILLHRRFSGKTHQNQLIVLLYLCLYSVLRFVLEFWRTDDTPTIGIWRWPQIISLLIIIFASLSYYLIRRYARKK
ncbi:MAG TPA: prolipoprotein diacylglyceryl transferase [bacterium]|nr:prolipoprotein diacylglyceryl transferase [bacterium]HPT29500.1 prolipoprotein diacylglyceryl transferase [bacterium]